MEQQSLCTDDCQENVIRFYSSLVYRLAVARAGNKSDADDIFQEVFLRYIKRKPEFQTEEHRKAWFIRVTINCANKLGASPWKRRTELLSDTPSFEFETKVDVELYQELQKLPAKYRTVIHLFYYEDLSIEQISRALNRKESTIRTQLTRARGKLKELLEEDEDV